MTSNVEPEAKVQGSLVRLKVTMVVGRVWSHMST